MPSENGKTFGKIVQTIKRTSYNRVETEREIPKLKLWVYMRIFRSMLSR